MPVVARTRQWRKLHSELPFPRARAHPPIRQHPATPLIISLQAFFTSWTIWALYRLWRDKLPYPRRKTGMMTSSSPYPLQKTTTSRRPPWRRINIKPYMIRTGIPRLSYAQNHCRYPRLNLATLTLQAALRFQHLYTHHVPNPQGILLLTPAILPRSHQNQNLHCQTSTQFLHRSYLQGLTHPYHKDVGKAFALEPGRRQR